MLFELCNGLSFRADLTNKHKGVYDVKRVFLTLNSHFAFHRLTLVISILGTYCSNIVQMKTCEVNN